MKTKLATNIEDFPLRLALLFEKAYSDGADLILSCQNTNKQFGTDSSSYSVFQAKIVYLSVSHKT